MTGNTPLECDMRRPIFPPLVTVRVSDEIGV
jgi:hypothetical protein